MSEVIDREPTEEELDMVRRVAWGMAKRYRIDIDEAVSDGMLGLVKGLRRLGGSETRENFLYQKVKWEIFEKMRARVRKHRGLEVQWPSHLSENGEEVLREFADESGGEPVVSEERLEEAYAVLGRLSPGWVAVVRRVVGGETIESACRAEGLYPNVMSREMTRAGAIRSRKVLGK